MIIGNKIVEVCASCGTAACWYGEFMCEDSASAGTEKKTVTELRKLKKESEHYWSDNKMNDIFGSGPAPFGYLSTQPI